LWSISPLIAFFAALSNGFTWSLLPVFISGFAPLLVFISTFFNPRSIWKLERFDYVCGFLSLLALILWLIFQEPNFAITLAIISDALAAIPTIRKAWIAPETESVFPFAVGIFTAIAGLIVIETWIYSEFAFNFYLIGINTILTGSIFLRKRILNKSASIK
jgi:hypothetical protein